MDINGEAGFTTALSPAVYTILSMNLADSMSESAKLKEIVEQIEHGGGREAKPAGLLPGAEEVGPSKVPGGEGLTISSGCLMSSMESWIRGCRPEESLATTGRMICNR